MNATLHQRSTSSDIDTSADVFLLSWKHTKAIQKRRGLLESKMALAYPGTRLIFKKRFVTFTSCGAWLQWLKRGRDDIEIANNDNSSN
ncbi:hypothetical protein M3J09_004153 [Ascochyta lentis]